MGIPELRIGDLSLAVPIIQGGMGVGVSKAGLAGAVSRAGGLGVIASVGLGGETGVKDLYMRASRQCLLDEIRIVKDQGLPVGVNIMVALSNYKDLVKACAEAHADVIISGAGLPLKLPLFVTDRTIKLAPIVSSGRATELICRTWWKRAERLPDVIVVEGPMAGGHLGFKFEDLVNNTAPSLEELLKDVLEIAEDYGQRYGQKIPVVAAGGIYTSHDIAEVLRLGADGVQMGTRFVGTHECDADDAYKQSYIDATEADIVLVKSPVGLPARVINNAFVEKSQSSARQQFSCAFRCLLSCNGATANYCIANALLNSASGQMSDGFAMAGQNAYRVDKLVSVPELMKELMEEWVHDSDSVLSAV